MLKYKRCPLCGKKLKLRRKKNEPLRLACSSCSFVYYNNPAPTTSGIILRNNKILFSQRAIMPKKNYWDLPGGFIEAGEHPEKTLKREIKEELGVKIKKLKFFGIYLDSYQEKHGSFSTLNVYYLIDIIGQPKPKDDVKDVKWFSAKNPPKKIAFKHIYIILRDLKNRK